MAYISLLYAFAWRVLLPCDRKSWSLAFNIARLIEGQTRLTQETSGTGISPALAGEARAAFDKAIVDYNRANEDLRFLYLLTEKPVALPVAKHVRHYWYESPRSTSSTRARRQIQKGAGRIRSFNHGQAGQHYDETRSKTQAIFLWRRLLPALSKRRWANLSPIAGSRTSVFKGSLRSREGGRTYLRPQVQGHL